MKFSIFLLLIVVTISLTAQSEKPDQITLADGSEYKGEILKNYSSSILFQTNEGHYYRVQKSSISSAGYNAGSVGYSNSVDNIFSNLVPISTYYSAGDYMIRGTNRIFTGIALNFLASALAYWNSTRIIEATTLAEVEDFQSQQKVINYTAIGIGMVGFGFTISGFNQFKWAGKMMNSIEL